MLTIVCQEEHLNHSNSLTFLKSKFNAGWSYSYSLPLQLGIILDHVVLISRAPIIST